MNRDRPKIFLGCVIAPLVAPLMILLIILVADAVSGSSYQYAFGLNQAKELGGIILMFLVLGAPIAYVITLVVGLPAYFIFKKLGLINFHSVTFGSAFVAVFPFLVKSAPHGFIIYEEPDKSSFLFYLAFALCVTCPGFSDQP
jgi:hypothetical protein